MHEKCPYSEFFWSVFSPNAEKYGPEKLRIRTLITQWETTSEISRGNVLIVLHFLIICFCFFRNFSHVTLTLFLTLTSTGTDLFKVNYGNTRTMQEIC